MDECIGTYFSRGYSYKDIIVVVKLRHGCDLSYRQLKEYLKRLGLKRRQPLDYGRIEAAMLLELQGSGLNLGCRSMSRRLLSRYGISVGRYSRRVMWLKVGRTNNDPKVIATYYLDCLSEMGGTPRCIRMDAGTENGEVANMQKAFRWFHEDAMSKEKSVIIGSSHANQRIECWWRRLHEMCIAGWQEILGEMEVQGIFSTAIEMHKEFLRFCFMQIIQSELDLVSQEWNDHFIRRQNNVEIHGKPEMLYHYPELRGTRDYKFPVSSDDIAALRQFCKSSTLTGCEEPLQSRLFEFLETTGQDQPETVDQAKELLQLLVTRFHI